MKTPLALSPLIAALFLSGCASIPTPVNQAYAGDARPESDVAHVVFAGSGFPDIYLYHVDGKPSASAADSFVPDTYSDAGSLGFDITVLPGEHVFEIYNVHKTPFDKAPLEYLSIGYSAEAGKSYLLARDGSSWKVTRDGKISASMHYLEPRWVCYNATDVAAMDPKYGSFTLRVPAGHHVIECTHTYRSFIDTDIGQRVRTLEFDAQAGKSYRIDVIPSTASGAGLADVEIKINAE